MLQEEFKNRIYPFKNRLFRFARWMIVDDLQAEDFVQEVFMKLWSMRNALEKYNNLEALAMRMIKNMCLNENKKGKKLAFALPAFDYIETLANPLEKLESLDKKHLLDTIIYSLSEQQRMVVQLRDIEGLSVAEIAEITELTENNIWVILSRARKNIRDAYLKFEKDEEFRGRRTSE